MVHVRNLPDSTETVIVTGVLHSSSIMSFWDPKKKPLPTKFGPQRPFSNIVVSQARVSRDPDQDPALDSPLYDHILSDPPGRPFPTAPTCAVASTSLVTNCPPCASTTTDSCAGRARVVNPVAGCPSR